MARKATSLTVLAAVTVTLALTSGRRPSHADDSAEGPGAQRQERQSQVALVDIGRVFRSHAGFAKSMEQLKTALLEVERRFVEESKQIRSLQDRLNTLEEQADEYAGLKELISTRKSSHESARAREKQRFMQMEADVYAETYQQIQRTIEIYARSHGIRLVIRFNSDPIDTSDANSVMKGVNRQVVFQDDLDITNEILRLVKD